MFRISPASHTLEQKETVLKKHSLSEAKVGESFLPVTYRLDSRVVEEFARFLQVSRPVSPSSHFVPPSMLAYYALWIAVSHFGFDTRGALFASMDLQLEGIAADGDTVTVQDSCVEDVFVRDAKRYVVLTSTSVNRQGKTLCRSKITAVFKAG